MRTPVQARPCQGCGSEHIGPRCPPGTTWLGRLRSVRLDPAATPTTTKHNYYDPQAVTEAFGDGAEERMYDATQGRGPAYRDSRGRFLAKDRHTGEVSEASPEHLDFLAGSGTEDG